MPRALRTTFDDKPSIMYGLARDAATRLMRTHAYYAIGWIGIGGGIGSTVLPILFHEAREKGWGPVAVGRPHLENQL